VKYEAVDIDEPNSKFALTELELPTLNPDLSESELPSSKWPKTETESPTVANDSTEKLFAAVTAPQAEMLLPRAANDLTEKLLPRRARDTMDTEPALTLENTETAEPTLPKFLKESELPRDIDSNKLHAEARINALTDRHEPSSNWP